MLDIVGLEYVLRAIEHVPQTECVAQFMNGNLSLEQSRLTAEHAVVEQRALLRDSTRAEGPRQRRVRETERTLRQVLVARNVQVERLRAIHVDYALHDRLIDPHCKIISFLVLDEYGKWIQLAFQRALRIPTRRNGTTSLTTISVVPIVLSEVALLVARAIAAL